MGSHRLACLYDECNMTSGQFMVFPQWLVRSAECRRLRFRGAVVVSGAHGKKPEPAWTDSGFLELIDAAGRQAIIC